MITLDFPKPSNIDDIITVSPSQLDVWYKCRFHWKLSYRENWTTGSNRYMKKGSISHLFLKEFYDLYIGSAVMPTSMDELLTIKNKHEGDYLQYEDLAMFYWAFSTFCRYTDYAANVDDFTPLATETEVWAPTPLWFDGRQVYLHGIIDLIVDRAGDLGVVDHKSYGSDRGKWSPDMVYFDQQLSFYMLALQLLGYEPKFGMINGLNTFEYKQVQPLDKLFSREEVYHKPKRLEIYKNNIYDTIVEMNEAKQFPKRWCKDCKFCGYREVCDVILRGQDPKPLLLTKHVKDTPAMQLADFTLDDMETE